MLVAHGLPLLCVCGGAWGEEGVYTDRAFGVAGSPPPPRVTAAPLTPSHGSLPSAAHWTFGRGWGGVKALTEKEEETQRLQGKPTIIHVHFEAAHAQCKGHRQATRTTSVRNRGTQDRQSDGGHFSGTPPSGAGGAGSGTLPLHSGSTRTPGAPTAPCRWAPSEEGSGA